MNLGDVAAKSVPKMTLVAPPRSGGAILTRTFIPHRCHKTIGVLGAVTVATAYLVPGSVAEDLARVPDGAEKALSIEHPSGEMTVIAHLDPTGTVARTEVLRTARKLMDGMVFPGA
jgi:4-oxalomesaconate tautomerase